jgi:RNA polymerase sigma factor (sigma-70 family)
MAHRSKFLLADPNGQPVAGHIQRVLERLRPCFEASFPTIRDEAAITQLFETVALKVARHEHRNGEAERLHGLAWTALKRQAISWMRTSSARAEARTLGTVEGAVELGRAPAAEFSPEQIERQILCSQILNQLSERDAQMLLWQQAGFSLREIAEHCGEPVNSVATHMSRLKANIRRRLARKGVME